MKNQQKSTRPAHRWPGRKHLKALITALAVWLGLFLVVLLEHGRAWAKLLPMIFVGIVVYGAFVTWKLVTEHDNNQYN